jgi:hypothetical protein
VSPAKKTPKKRQIEGSGRVTPKGGNSPVKKITLADGEHTPDASTRYTPPTPHADELPSPMWVPILMFTLWGLGMAVIILNYVSLLPGAPNNWYLMLGLGFILGGIITATQYR